jgi:hypothetical protein
MIVIATIFKCEADDIAMHLPYTEGPPLHTSNKEDLHHASVASKANSFQIKS